MINKVNITEEKRKDKESREYFNLVLTSFNTRESLIYWINVLVKRGKLSEVTAGRLIFDRGL